MSIYSIPSPNVEDVTFRRQVASYLRETSVSSKDLTASTTLGREHIYKIDATSGNVTVTVPLATAAGLNRIYYLERMDASANTVTVDFSGSDTTVRNETFLTLDFRGSSLFLISDGEDTWITFEEVLTGEDLTFSGDVTFGGTLTVSSMTAGSILFAGSSGLVSQDNANLFWDDTNNKLLLGNGSAAHPSYSFVNDSNTGFFWIADGRMQISINGAARWQIQTSEMGGASSVDPTFRRGTSLTSPGLLPWAADTNTGIGGNGSDVLTLVTGGTARITMDAAGNAGLGTGTFGTSAVRVWGISNGTAPTTRPADMIQMWAADFAAGDSRLYILTESGTNPIRLGNGVVYSDRAICSQNSTTAAVPVLSLIQSDVSEEFIRYEGTAASSNLTQSIVDSGDVTTFTPAGYLKIFVTDLGNQITDQAYYLQIGTLA